MYLQGWNLAEVTQNYLRLLVGYLKYGKRGQILYSVHVVTFAHFQLLPLDCKGDGGILVHCISGWDRTPLFISLLRLSLWAVSGYNSLNNFCYDVLKINTCTFVVYVYIHVCMYRNL